MLQWQQNITKTLSSFPLVLKPGWDGIPVLCIDKVGMHQYANTITDPAQRAWAHLTITEQ